MLKNTEARRTVESSSPVFKPFESSGTHALKEIFTKAQILKINQVGAVLAIVRLRAQSCSKITESNPSDAGEEAEA